MRRWVVVLLLLAALCSGSALSAQDDRQTYQRIVERVHAGQNYYDAASAELRIGHFPLKPALAFRLPTLAVVEAALPSTLARALTLWALAAAALIGLTRSFPNVSAFQRVSIAATAMSGLANVGAPGSIYLHEAWSIVFVVGALAARRSTAASALLLLVAALFRETAAMAVIAFMADAVLSQRWRRAATYATALGLFGLLWLLHAQFAAGATLPADPRSPGWIAFGGLPMVVSAFKWNLVLALAPIWLGSILVAGSLAFACQNPDLRAAGIYGVAFIACLLVLGRPDNAYWGIMFSPVLLLGVPGLLVRLVDHASTARRPAEPQTP